MSMLMPIALQHQGLGASCTSHVTSVTVMTDRTGVTAAHNVSHVTAVTCKRLDGNAVLKSLAIIV